MAKLFTAGKYTTLILRLLSARGTLWYGFRTPNSLTRDYSFTPPPKKTSISHSISQWMN